MTDSVLVTGASGFIGSALVRTLARRGVAVTATARRPSDALAAELGVPVARLDLDEPVPMLAGVHTIVHCATPNDIASRGPDGALPLAVMGTRALLERAVADGVTRFVYLSTLQVYGTELSGVVDEATPPRCETMYGLNHFLGEEVCRFYARTAGIDIVVLRPANVYGVPASAGVDRWTLVPMCFVRDAGEHGELALRSSGRQRRNFVSTDEVCDAIGHVLDDFPAGFTIVNVASDWYASIADIAELTAATWESETGRALPVRILSDEPAAPAAFTVATRSAIPRLSPAASAARMGEVIRDLIRNQRPH